MSLESKFSMKEARVVTNKGKSKIFFLAWIDDSFYTMYVEVVHAVPTFEIKGGLHLSLLPLEGNCAVAVVFYEDILVCDLSHTGNEVKVVLRGHYSVLKFLPYQFRGWAGPTSLPSRSLCRGIAPRVGSVRAILPEACSCFNNY